MLDRHGALTAIEFDRDLLEPLAAAAQSHGALTLVHADVLDVDFTALAAAGDGDPGDRADRRLRLVGNLPYNLSSPILFHALDHAAAIRDMHFMLQKEVVDRMAAGPGSKVYGRLSVMLQAECAVTPLFKVAPGAFRPAPKVDSAVVRAAFGQRRKTLRNALGSLMDAAAIEAAGLRPDARAEQVPVDGFVRLANLPAAVSPPPG
jgi:16S rRNA (adenine1518-N6/adenine1519-N6)-dimethyltransferase